VLYYPILELSIAFPLCYYVKLKSISIAYNMSHASDRNITCTAFANITNRPLEILLL
jgi:hypothetical protein